MKVPGFDLATVSRAKIVDYLLSPTHREGAGKAVFFRTMGFAVETLDGTRRCTQAARG